MLYRDSELSREIDQLNGYFESEGLGPNLVASPRRPRLTLFSVISTADVILDTEKGQSVGNGGITTRTKTRCNRMRI